MHEISEIPTNVDITSIKLQKLQQIWTWHVPQSSKTQLIGAVSHMHGMYFLQFTLTQPPHPHKNHENLSSKTYNKTKVILPNQHISPSTTQQNHLEDMFAPCLKHNTTCTNTPILNWTYPTTSYIPTSSQTLYAHHNNKPDPHNLQWTTSPRLNPRCLTLFRHLHNLLNRPEHCLGPSNPMHAIRITQHQHNTKPPTHPKGIQTYQP